MDQAPDQIEDTTGIFIVQQIEKSKGADQLALSQQRSDLLMRGGLLLRIGVVIAMTIFDSCENPV